MQKICSFLEHAIFFEKQRPENRGINPATTLLARGTGGARRVDRMGGYVGRRDVVEDRHSGSRRGISVFLRALIVIIILVILFVGYDNWHALSGAYESLIRQL